MISEYCVIGTILSVREASVTYMNLGKPPMQNGLSEVAAEGEF